MPNKPQEEDRRPPDGENAEGRAQPRRLNEMRGGAGHIGSSTPLTVLTGRTALSDIASLKAIENVMTGVIARYEWMGRVASRALLDAGVLKAIEGLRLLPQGFEIPALASSAYVARALSGPSTLSAMVAAQEAGQRVLTLIESPAWIKMVRHQAELVEGFGGHSAFTQISRALMKSMGSFAQLGPLSVIQRPVSIGTQAWAEVLRKASDDPDEPELARVFATGRATVGIVSSGVALLDEEDPVVLSQDTQELLVRDALGERLRQKLGSLHPDLPGRLDGAWERIGRPGPDAASQAAHSLSELVDWALRLGAPDEEVLAWHAREGKGAEELHEGKPTRSLRAKYILRNRSVDARIARMYLRSMGELFDIIQSKKHGIRRDEVDAVAPLLPTAEGLLVFLFVSGR